MSATGDGNGRGPLDLAALRAEHGRGNGPWRSLDELADTPAFRDFAQTEFPSLGRFLSGERDGRVDRRTVLKVMGAVAALGGLAGCEEAERIVPYVRQPENVVPGKPRNYATTLLGERYGLGAVVETHEGRPTKIEGNPDHPASLGATDAVMQAEVLTLFDPERSALPLENGRPASHDAFLRELAAMRVDLADRRGRGLALLVGSSTSPTLEAQLERVRITFPEARIFRHAPLASTAGKEATRALFGRELVPVFRFDRASTILDFDSDFLAEGPARLANARAFAAARRVRGPDDEMNRLYALETTPTITGAAADHRRAFRPSDLAHAVAAFAATLAGEEAGHDGPVARPWRDAVIADLRRAGPSAMVVPGEHHGAAAYAAAIGMNMRLGSIGRTMDFIEPPDTLHIDGDLVDLVVAIQRGEADTLLTLDANPVHTGPADLEVAETLRQVPHLIHLGLYRDETAALAHWHLPAAHVLERWSDARAFDGTASLVQPLIRPLYAGHSIHEVLAALLGDFAVDGLAIVRRTWADLDDGAWQRALQQGVIADTAFSPLAVNAAVPAVEREPAPSAEADDGTLEIRFVADAFLRDGRYANASWLQELPRPITKLVWGNAALVSPATAERLGLSNEQLVRLTRGARNLEAPVWITPGHPDGSMTLSLGYRRALAGSVADLAGGYDAFALRTRDALWLVRGVAVTPLEERGRVLTTQHHHAMEGRHIVRHATLAEFRDDPDFVHEEAPAAGDASLYPEWQYPRQSWGMSIDQTACIGCMACVAACQSENNIPVVGPEETARGREMHWLRVDRYYEGALDEPETHFQPVPCMHCEKAPCEVVCPVNATVHTHDGLNAQVYNRCIGTRYCSQNCPYKVRRFNFIDHQPFEEGETGPEQARRNPDVSVRSRGVMEKCTYCVQRISAARIQAKIENRDIADGEVVTACQQACPTEAIVFGDLNQAEAAVVEAKSAPHDYALLGELNTRPRTTYLGKLRNPNPRLDDLNSRPDGPNPWLDDKASSPDQGEGERGDG